MKKVLLVLLFFLPIAQPAFADPFVIGAGITALLNTTLIGSITIGQVVVGAAPSRA